MKPGKVQSGKVLPRGVAGGWKDPRRRRASWRRIALWAVLAFLVGYPLCIYLDNTFSSGITQEGSLLQVNLKSMSNFEIDQDHGQDSDIPSVYRHLDGRQVKLIGEMYDPYVAAGQIRNFTLVYSRTTCCFNGPPKVQHLVQATVPPGQNIQYTADPVTVVGTLHVGVEQSNGHIQSIYRIDVDRVERD